MVASAATNANFIALLDALAEGYSMPKATAIALGTKSKTAWVWLRNAKRDRDAGIPITESKFVVRDFPEENEDHWLDHAFKIAADIARGDFHLEVLEEIRKGTRPVFQDGNVVYEIDHQAIADWGGDKTAARDLGGLTDAFYKHDASGARIPLRVRDRTSSQLTIAALKTVNPQWNVEQRVDARMTHGGVLTLRGADPTKQVTASPSVRQRLADLRSTKAPQDQVEILGKFDPTDPVEGIGSGPVENPELKPLAEDRRAYRVQTPAAPAPQTPSYARPSERLDAQDRRGPLPPGGFSLTRPGRTTS